MHMRAFPADSNAPEYAVDPPIITLSSASNRTQYREFIHTLLQPGSYTLQLSPPADYHPEGAGMMVFVELAIETMANVNQLIAESPESPTCPSFQFGAIRTDPNGYYQSGSNYATLNSDLLLNNFEFALLDFYLDRYLLKKITIKTGNENLNEIN